MIWNENICILSWQMSGKQMVQDFNQLSNKPNYTIYFTADMFREFRPVHVMIFGRKLRVFKYLSIHVHTHLLGGSGVGKPVTILPKYVCKVYETFPLLILHYGFIRCKRFLYFASDCRFPTTKLTWRHYDKQRLCHLLLCLFVSLINWLNLKF